MLWLTTMKPSILLLNVLFRWSLADLVLPQPNGPYGVDVAVAELIDTSRTNPFAPHHENLCAVISIFHPSGLVVDCDWKLIPAYPKNTAAIFDAEVAFAGVPNGTLEEVRMQVCRPSSDPTATRGRSKLSPVPIVFFSPGLGLSRLWYSAIAQSVASFGFNVITIDLPYDADVVEFPDGHIIKAINSTWDQRQSELDVNVRAAEISFILDELSKPNVGQRILGPYSAYLIPDTAGIFGHSIGGAAAASVMYEDPRIIGGVNLDGGLYGPVIHNGLNEPLMLFGHKSNDTSPTWIQNWPYLNWKLDIEILNSTHTTFTDIPLLANLIFGDKLPPLVEGVVGHIPGERARDIVSAYVAAFMNFALKGEPQKLLQGPSPLFPEIEFDASPRQRKNMLRRISHELSL